MTDNKDFAYHIRGALDDEVAVEIYDSIGAPSGVTLKSFTRDLAKVSGKRLFVSLHSEGGNLLDALGMYSLLRD